MYNRQEIKFKILKIFEFNSDRKRMTVVVEWIGIGAVMAFVKGADSSIRKILSPNQKYL
jgi:magnesium-transporting ATPase (P-type)